MIGAYKQKIFALLDEAFWDVISCYNINTSSRRQVMRIQKIINISCLHFVQEIGNTCSCMMFTWLCDALALSLGKCDSPYYSTLAFNLGSCNHFTSQNLILVLWLSFNLRPSGYLTVSAHWVPFRLRHVECLENSYT